MLRTIVVLLALAACALAQYECPAPSLNDCVYASATDLSTATATVYFTYPSYDPPCIIVSVGQKVTFNGSFDGHPLQPGVANNTDVVPSGDTTSPFYISPDMIVDTGDTYTYTFNAAGAFPYYCQITGHATSGMRGVVYVGNGCIAPPMAPVAAPVASPVAPVAAPKAAPVARTPAKSDAAKLVFSAAAVVVGAALL